MPYEQNLADLSVKPHDYYAQTRPEMLAFIPKSAQKILDVGCGEGIFGQQLKNNPGVEVWGIEIDSQAGAVAQKHLNRVFVGDINQVLSELPDNFFDCIVCNDVLEHLVDPYTVLERFKTKLAPSGVVVASLPNVRYLLNLFDLLVKKQWKYVDAGILDKTHLRFFTRRSIMEVFQSLRYEIVRFEGINPITSWKFTILNILSFGYLADTKYLQFAIVAKPK